MKRLYNEYSAAPAMDKNVQMIDTIVDAAFQQIWNLVIQNDICPRDTESLCHNMLAVLFAEKILIQAQMKTYQTK